MAVLPVIRLSRVYHVGTLDPALRGTLHRSSQEGPCLSVSLCPQSWVEIARLGGSPLFALERDGAEFFDVLAAMDDPELRTFVLQWAEDEGLLAFREQWKAWQYDDETEEWRYFLADTREEAEAEVDEFSRGPDDGPATELLMGFLATDELYARLGCGLFNPAFAIEFAFMQWAREGAPIHAGRSFDGVWFREDHAPERLSAPRGGIFPEAVASWSASAASWCAVTEEDAPDTTLEPLPSLNFVPTKPVPAPV